jgi:hypothetical protein
VIRLRYLKTKMCRLGWVILCVIIPLQLGCSEGSSASSSDAFINGDMSLEDAFMRLPMDSSSTTDTIVLPTPLDGRVTADADAPPTPLDGSVMIDAGAPLAPATTCERRTESIHAVRGRTLRVSPVGAERVQLDGREMSLRSAINEAEPGDTVLLMDGVYVLPEAPEGNYSGVYARIPDVTIRGESTDPSRVVIDSSYRGHGGSSGAITIDAPRVTLANLTVRRSIFHLVHLLGNADGVTVHNVRLLDGGQQFLKSSGGGDANIDDVVVSCSHFEMTEDGRRNVWGYGGASTHCYTGGIDSHVGRRWSIHDNSFRGIHCMADENPRPAHGRFPEQRGDELYVGGLAEHAIHMWDAPDGEGHMIERNVIIDCARGIGIGMRNSVFDTVIRNNAITSRFPGGVEHDVGISIERAHNFQLLHNSLIFTHEAGYPNGIEVRWDETSNVLLRGNLLNRVIRLRNGAEAMQEQNREDASTGWFRAPAEGDLHLQGCPPELSEGIPSGDFISDDIDEETRPEFTTIGADQCTE